MSTFDRLKSVSKGSPQRMGVPSPLIALHVAADPGDVAMGYREIVLVGEVKAVLRTVLQSEVANGHVAPAHDDDIASRTSTSE